MQVVNPQIVSGKKVLLRYDIDVALGKGTPRQGSGQAGDSLQVIEDFKLKAGLATLNLCLEHASQVILMGHVGRPFTTAEDEKKGNPPDLSAKPIYEWFKKEVDPNIEFAETLEQAQKSNSKFILFENIRFFHGEELGSTYHAVCSSKTCDIDFAHKLASLGDIYVNEAFSSYRPAVSTTILPTLLPHAVGLYFIKEVETLLNIRNNPKKPLIAIMGGAKISEKLLVIKVLAKKADAVLVGGKLVAEIREQNIELAKNVMVGKLTDDGFDIAPETTESWKNLIMRAKMIVWNGPLGKFEDPQNDQTKKVGELVIASGAETIVGGGDTISLLNQLDLLDKFSFISVGGGAMLKFLSDGTLPTIEALT